MLKFVLLSQAEDYSKSCIGFKNEKMEMKNTPAGICLSVMKG
jgi:hypothetical protein